MDPDPFRVPHPWPYSGIQMQPPIPGPSEGQPPVVQDQRVALELTRETVKLRELELQIAAEKRKEREAELAVLQLQLSARSAASGSAMPMASSSTPMPSASMSPTFHPANGYGAPDPLNGGLGTHHDFNFLSPAFNQISPPIWSEPPPSNGLYAPPQLHSEFPPERAFDDILNELLDKEADFSVSQSMAIGNWQGAHPTLPAQSMDALMYNPDITPPIEPPESGGMDDTSTPSTGTSISTPLPAPITVTRRGKKQLVEHLASCSACGTGIAKLVLRGTPSELDATFQMQYLCEQCAPAVDSTQTARRRVKQTGDTSLPMVCDVCLRTRGKGGLVPSDPAVGLPFSVEVVCLPCTMKYKRCSDCGGGSGRLGVGKWRCKELFEDGRKTCKLSHARLGTGELELAVWEVPQDIQDEVQVEQVLDACEALWREGVLRLAVPEMLESDLDAPVKLRTFQDIETKILDPGWPARAFLLKDDTQLSGQRKFLALTWAKNRPRRSKTTTIGQWDGKVAKDEDWLFSNIRRTKVFYPAGSMLVGLWMSHWHVANQAIHITTTCPFEPGDVEDRSVVSIAEMINRIIAEGTSDPNVSVPPPAHLWVTYTETSPITESRIEDALIKKKAFFPLDEYVQRFPDVGPENFVEPSYTRIADVLPGGRTWKQEGRTNPVRILVKSLGKSLNWYRLQQIKLEELHQKRLATQIVRKRKVDTDSTTT